MSQLIKQYETSKGGLVQEFVGVIRHTAAQGFYSGDIAETGVMPALPVKRGRGRPRKDVGESGAVFDFSAFRAPKVPKWTGPSRKFVFSKGE